jgi:predicted Rossmann-fold nucleotide-binding protein
VDKQDEELGRRMNAASVRLADAVCAHCGDGGTHAAEAMVLLQMAVARSIVGYYTAPGYDHVVALFCQGLQRMMADLALQETAIAGHA